MRSLFFVAVLTLGGAACRDPIAMPADLGPSTQPDGGAADMTGQPQPDMPPPLQGNLLLRGTIVTPTGPMQGEVLIDGNLISCVAATCTAGSATIVDTGGIILPGLIDAHNHGLFNIFDETDWTPTITYDNHNTWTNEMRYQQVVDAKQYLSGESGSPVDVRCEMDKWGELKALLAGTTSMVVAPGTSRACFSSIIRTIDTPQNDLGIDKIQTSISVPATATAQGVCDNFTDGSTDAYVVHVAEGTNASARNEFATLSSRANGCLLSPKTTIVHGTALTMTEFTTMATNNMRLVWSPKSNMFLYNDTTRIDLAIQAGVTTIALAPDWALGGSINMLDEIRFAEQTDATKFGDILTPERIFKMATIDAAKTLGAESLIGSIEVGKRADLFVIPGTGDPYLALQDAKPATIKLVVVDGKALYGDKPLSPAGCDTLSVCNVEKFACIAEMSGQDKLAQTYADIKGALETALTNYDAANASQAALSPLAPLFHCP